MKQEWKRKLLEIENRLTNCNIDRIYSLGNVEPE